MLKSLAPWSLGCAADSKKTLHALIGPFAVKICASAVETFKRKHLMAVLRTPDFDVFLAATHGMRGGILLCSRPERLWRMRSEALPTITLTLAREAAGTIFSGRSDPEFFHCIIPIAAEKATLVNGIKLGPGDLIWLAPDEPCHIVRMSPSYWVDICLESSVVERWLDGPNQVLTRDVAAHTCVVPARDHLTNLLLVVREAFRLHRFLANDQQFKGMKSTLSDTLADCLRAIFAGQCHGDVICRMPGRHSGILQATLELIDSSDACMPATDVMRSASHTTERTIRNVFHEFFGISPHRYLMLRRLHSIRRAIRDGQARENITSICARHNVWDFGRFSGQYKDCFGVLPSADLIEARQGHGGAITSGRRLHGSADRPETHKAAISQ